MARGSRRRGRRMEEGRTTGRNWIADGSLDAALASLRIASSADRRAGLTMRGAARWDEGCRYAGRCRRGSRRRQGRLLAQSSRFMADDRKIGAAVRVAAVGVETHGRIGASDKRIARSLTAEVAAAADVLAFTAIHDHVDGRCRRFSRGRRHGCGASSKRVRDRCTRAHTVRGITSTVAPHMVHDARGKGARRARPIGERRNRRRTGHGCGWGGNGRGWRWRRDHR